MVLENILRGSGDIGAMLSGAWGIRQIDSNANRVWVENVKSRDFQACAPFILEGRPYIDKAGNFCMINPPGTAEELSHYVNRGGRPSTDEKDSKIELCVRLKKEGKSLREIGKQAEVSYQTVKRWINRNRELRERP